jgi:hypothetical protein
MAVNVYMVFFFAANPKSFLNYWWAYFLVCYGIPLIPALWLLLVRGDSRGEVYGNATVSSSQFFCDLFAQLTNARYGVGLTRIGALCAFTPTTSRSGCAFSFPLAST